ncbi:efflux RND transporter periplasmic adaptor subunit [Tsuneonella sp. YG55]|uniref:Efflux RND transporter periplasmic adaptor subunit n=1 Tax=Tsuneonella litorea TaxID=2976475 RepID=A0A9X2W3A2_9SPHN|nr:efflux RND transporter periplasmic adaptor subunit [Tsuneonella litorea]MCT2560210.1 efflux RND transporter periplasmic adaptor subunit [Tsuneonella litorea]
MTRRKTFIALGAVLIAAILSWIIWGSAGNAPTNAPPPSQTASASIPSEIRLTDAQMQTAEIALATVEAGDAGELIVPGTVRAAPSAVARLDARANGVVARILKTLGDPVRRGETVALLESAEAATLAEQVASAAARAQQARAAYDREKRLFEANVTARQDIEAAQAALSMASAELTRARAAVQATGVTRDGRSIAVTSPVGGRVTAAPAVLGSYVTAGTELFRVVDPSRLQIEAALSPADASKVAVGDVATISLPGGGQVDARVRSITPSVDLQTRASTAVLSLRSAPPGLQPDSFVEVRLTTEAASGSVLSVPADAVQDLNGQSIVFVRTNRGFRVSPVTTGQRSAGRVTILSGVTQGQQIASRNAFLIKAEIAKQGEGDE